MNKAAKVEARLIFNAFKVDEVKREVWGIATSSAVDKTNEVCDYKAMKPLIQAWSEEFAEATKGLGDEQFSLGNIREMHTDKAVGKAIAIEFDDENELVTLGAKIVDDDAWKKCWEGVYTGFSIGGKYVGAKVKQADGTVKVVIKPAEFSTVDNPCNPDAHFTAVKSDGTTEVHKFAASAAQESTMAAAKKAIRLVATTAKKGMYQIGYLADILQQIKYLADDSTSEGQWEGDPRDAEIAKRLTEWLKTGIPILQQIVTDETSELVAAGEDESAALATLIGDASKAGAKHSKATLDAVAKCTGALDTMGKCFGNKCDHEDVGKCFGNTVKCHGDATDAMKYFGSGDEKEDQEDKDGKNAPVVVHKVHNGTGGGPESEDDAMKQEDAAKLNQAATDSASAVKKAEEVAQQIETLDRGLDERIAKAVKSVLDTVAKPTGIVANVAAVSASKADDPTKVGEAALKVKNEPETVDPNAPNAAVKSVLSKPLTISGLVGRG